MPNVRLTLAYDGTAYHGFQKQSGSGLPTIQETLERCLAELSGAALKVTGAGRTDAGVHARGQVVNFATGGWGIPTDRIPAALNGVLPGDIAAVEACEVPADFHARYSATAKTYSYTLFNHPVRSPFWRLYSLHVPGALDLRAMRLAGRHLVGRHDFSAFQATGRPVQSAVRTLTRADVTVERCDRRAPCGARPGPPVVEPVPEYPGPMPVHPRAAQARPPDPPGGPAQAGSPGGAGGGPLVVRLVFSADGFLYNMVRIMVGTLLEAGLGRLEPEALPDIIAAGDRARAGPTAPPHGLCLESVDY